MVINSRVVIVGASDTAVSLLETLIFSPHLSFNNLTLISPSGLHSAGSSLPSGCCYWPESLSSIGLTAWVHIVHGYMVAINRYVCVFVCAHSISPSLSRDEKQVIVWCEDSECDEGGEDGVVPYDQLILCTGLQFKPPPSSSITTTTSDNDGEIPLIYDPNEGIDVSQWTNKYIQPEGEYNILWVALY